MTGYFKPGALYVLLGLAGCAAVKKNKESDLQKTKTKTAVELKQNIHHKADLNAESLILRRDSAGLNFKVEIWPSGPFSYSPYKGFEGTAQKIVWFGHEEQRSALLKQQKMQQQREAEGSLNISEQKEQDLKILSKKSGLERKPFVWTWKGWAVAGILLLLIAFWIWRKLR